MVSNSDGTVMVNEIPIDQGGESLSCSLKDENRKLSEVQSTVFAAIADPSKLARITLQRDSQGLGFNIVGGKDSQHIPGHSGIFVSIIKSDSPAHIDGRLSVGDLILSINDIELVNKTHDEAVSIFRSQNQSSVDLLVEVGAESRILNEQLSRSTHIHSNKSPAHIDPELLKSPATPAFPRSFGDGFHLRSTPSHSLVDDLRVQDEDVESVTSAAPSMHSLLDDVPRTPKRPMSYLDPRNPSLVTEVLYVSIGLAVISLGVFVVYRIIRGRR